MRKSNRWFSPVGGAVSCGGGLSRGLLETLKSSVSSQLQLEPSVQLKRVTLITMSILGTAWRPQLHPYRQPIWCSLGNQAIPPQEHILSHTYSHLKRRVKT